MTPQEVADLLRFCSSVDPWLKQTTPEEGAVMVGGWALILDEVPADQAMIYARWHYGQGGSRTITPGDIRDWWHTGTRNAAREADAARTRELVHVSGVQEALSDELEAPLMSEYLTNLVAALDEGLPVSSVMKPEGCGSLTPAADRWMRRCRWHDVCVCDHTACRDGWLDQEAHEVTEGRVYVRVQRCPSCDDAFQMSGTRSITRKPKAGTHR